MKRKTKSERNQIELYFEWWLNDLKAAGYVKEYVREPEKFSVLPTAPYGRYKRFKTKPKEREEFNLFPKIDYTCDYKITWTEKAEYIFYEKINETQTFLFGRPLFVADEFVGAEEGTFDTISYVDVKPTTSAVRQGAKASTSHTFPLKARMLWEHHCIFINKCVPIPMSGTGFNSALFTQSFVPVRYLTTDGGKQQRKIKWSYKLMQNYINERVGYMNNLMRNTK
jgi:hypothetical protein